MGDCMEFQANPLDFIKAYSFKDKEEIYTNGSDLVPVFRVEQMIDHYFNSRAIIRPAYKLGDIVYLVSYFGSGVLKATVTSIRIRNSGVEYQLKINNGGFICKAEDDIYLTSEDALEVWRKKHNGK